MVPCVLDKRNDTGESRLGDRVRGAASADWYAVHVKSRHEFVAADELARKGIEAYLPAMNKISQWKDRKKLIACALFPGYIFVRIAHYPGAFLPVLKTRGVLAFVSLEPGTPSKVAADEIDSLRILIDSGKELDVYPGLRQGARVRIKNGPLSNVEGVLSRNDKELVFSVNVELLGRSVAVKVTPPDIEAL